MRRHRWPVLVLAGGLCLAAGAAPEGIRAASHGAPAPSAGEQRAALNSLQALDHAILPGGNIVIRLVFRYEVKEPPRFFASYHPRAQIVLDFANTASELRNDPVEVGQRVLRSLQVVQEGDRTRLIINLVSPVVRETAHSGREVLITLRRAAN